MLVPPITGINDLDSYLYKKYLDDANTGVTSLDSVYLDATAGLSLSNTALESVAKANDKATLIATSAESKANDCLGQIQELSDLVSLGKADVDSRIDGVTQESTLMVTGVDAKVNSVVDTINALIAKLALTTTSVVTNTADFTVADTDTYLINNKAGSTCTVTLPVAADSAGRVITIQNYQAFTVVSASANVVPIGGGVAGTAILLGVPGNWATLISNGISWVIMQAAANNNLLLE